MAGLPKRRQNAFKNAVTTIGLGIFTAVTHPPWWRILKGLTLICHRVSPLRQLVPGPVCSSLQKVWKPVVGLQLCTWLVRQYVPIACRTLHLWQGVLRVYSAYMWTKHRCNSKQDWTDEDVSRVWAARHEWGAEQVHKLVLDLSGYYVKAAQILASKQEFMPRQWTARLSGLFDNMPSQPWEAVKHSIDHHLQQCPMAQEAEKVVDIYSVFSSIDAEPAASASIAQVHFAHLSREFVEQMNIQDTHCGYEVAIKVQHAGIERLMVSDLINLGLLARFLRHVLPFDPIPVVNEIRESIPREFDFIREMRMMELLRTALHEGGVTGVNIPMAITPLCSSRMLIQERMQGVRFTDLLQRVHVDPQLKAAAQEAVMQLLLAYGHMILHQGVFHADPHPGNLLLQDGNEVALLDFGQVGVLSAHTVRAFAHLVLAMQEGNQELIALSVMGLGLNFSPRNSGSVPCLEHVAGMVYVMLDTRPMQEACLNPFDLSHHPMFKETSISNLPSHMWMLVRTFMLLRGLTHTLHMDVSTATLWRDLATAALNDPLLDARCTAHMLVANPSCTADQQCGKSSVSGNVCLKDGAGMGSGESGCMVSHTVGHGGEGGEGSKGGKCSWPAAALQLPGDEVKGSWPAAALQLLGDESKGSWSAAALQCPGDESKGSWPAAALQLLGGEDGEGKGSWPAAALQLLGSSQGVPFLDWEAGSMDLPMGLDAVALSIMASAGMLTSNVPALGCGGVASESSSDGGRREFTLPLSAAYNGSEDSSSDPEVAVVEDE